MTGHGPAILFTNSDASGPPFGRLIQSRKCPFPVHRAAPSSPNRAWKDGSESQRIGNKACCCNGNSLPDRNNRRYQGGLSFSGLLICFTAPKLKRFSITRRSKSSAALSQFSSLSPNRVKPAASKQTSWFTGAGQIVSRRQPGNAKLSASSGGMDDQ